MAHSLRSSIDLGNGGDAIRSDVANKHVIASLKPFRWMSGHLGRKDAIPRDLITQRRYINVATANPPTISYPSNLNGREAVDFSASANSGLCDPAKVPSTFRSFSFLMTFQVMAAFTAGKAFLSESTIAANGFLFNWPTTNSYRFSMGGTGVSFVDINVGASPATGTIVTMAGTFDNATKALKIYKDDMSTPATSATTTDNSVVPSGEDYGFYYGNQAPDFSIAAQIAVADLVMFDRALVAADLVTVKAALDAMEGF